MSTTTFAPVAASNSGASFCNTAANWSLCEARLSVIPVKWGAVGLAEAAGLADAAAGLGGAAAGLGLGLAAPAHAPTRTPAIDRARKSRNGFTMTILLRVGAGQRSF